MGIDVSIHVEATEPKRYNVIYLKTNKMKRVSHDLQPNKLSSDRRGNHLRMEFVMCSLCWTFLFLTVIGIMKMTPPHHSPHRPIRH